MVAHPIDGRYGDSNACLKSVLQYWKNTTTGLDREGQPVDPRIISSTTHASPCVVPPSSTGNLPNFQFINGPLQQETNLARQKRTRKSGTILHFVYLGTLLWKHGWHRYSSPKDRLDL